MNRVDNRIRRENDLWVGEVKEPNKDWQAVTVLCATKCAARYRLSKYLKEKSREGSIGKK